jgi:hypothetical protein
MKQLKISTAQVLLLMSILFVLSLIFLQDLLIAFTPAQDSWLIENQLHKTFVARSLISIIPVCIAALLIIGPSLLILLGRIHSLRRWETAAAIVMFCVGIFFWGHLYTLRDMIQWYSHQEAYTQLVKIGRQQYSTKPYQDDIFHLPSEFSIELGQKKLIVLYDPVIENHWIVVPSRESFIVYIDGEQPTPDGAVFGRNEPIFVTCYSHIENWYFCNIEYRDDVGPFARSRFLARFD